MRRSVRHPGEHILLVRCNDCRKWHPYESAPMIRDDLWVSIAPDRFIKLCLGCMERRLGRRVTPDDFGTYGDSWFNGQFMKHYYGRKP